MTGMPPLDWQRAPCPACGATTVKEAETMCKPQRDETGESDCAGSEREDAEGFLLQPTAASIAVIDAWCDEQLAAEEAAEQPSK